jgi:CHAT domain-containing protein
MHLACHGYQDTDFPLNSGFVMRDNMLTVSHLMTLSLPHAFLAFLSACETAKCDSRQPDQAVHLAAAMLFAGFKSIVATMW